MDEFVGGHTAELVTELELLRSETVRLRRQNAILRETLDTVEGSVVVYGPGRRYLLANQAYHTLFPHLPPDEELVGRRYEEVLGLSLAAGWIDDPAGNGDPAAYAAKRAADLDRRLAGEELTARETYNAKSGRWYLLRSRRTPTGNVVTLRVDITAQKQLQASLRQTSEAAENSSRMKSQFLGNITHELRTPLNAVINFAQLIAEQAHGPVGAPEYRTYARDIQDSGIHLLTLIDELLDLARAEAGRLTIVEGMVHPRRLIASACRVLAPEAAKAGITLEYDIAPGLGSLCGDAHRLKQVLLNLVANAIKFTDRGGAVCVAAVSDPDGALRITVRDNGIGIAEGDLARVMEPFEQADSSGVQRPGVGLGLPLSRHLIELHGGTLRLESERGVGTSAVLTLPASRVVPFVRHPADA
ncbi:MAG: ATP-binding protein [Acetobacteraceae bacterium]